MEVQRGADRDRRQHNVSFNSISWIHEQGKALTQLAVEHGELKAKYEVLDELRRLIYDMKRGD